MQDDVRIGSLLHQTIGLGVNDLSAKPAGKVENA